MVSFFEKGDTKIYHCAKPLVVYKRRRWPFPCLASWFWPGAVAVVPSDTRSVLIVCAQGTERKLASDPNVLTTSFRYGDKSLEVDTSHQQAHNHIGQTPFTNSFFLQSWNVK